MLLVDDLDSGVFVFLFVRDFLDSGVPGAFVVLTDFSSSSSLEITYALRFLLVFEEVDASLFALLAELDFWKYDAMV